MRSAVWQTCMLAACNGKTRMRKKKEHARSRLQRELVRLGQEEEEDKETLAEIDATCLRLKAHLTRLGEDQT